MLLFWDGVLSGQVVFQYCHHYSHWEYFIIHFPSKIQLNFDVVNWAADMTDVALEWAEKNVKSNPHISELIEIRKVDNSESTPSIQESLTGKSVQDESNMDMSGHMDEEAEPSSSSSFNLPAGARSSYHGPPVLVGVVRDGEQFDFCICNPPFFESMEEAGLNPKTSCGGTPEEMVCSGGERAFITRIIEDSVALKQTFRYSFSLLVLLHPCLTPHIFLHK